MDYTVTDNECIKVTVKTTISDFFKEERMKSLFSENDYTVSKKFNKFKSEHPDIYETSYDELYFFHKTLPGIYDMTITPADGLKITITDLSQEHRIYEMIEKLFGPEEFKDRLCFIRDFTTDYYHGNTALTYKELANYGIKRLLPELHKDDQKITVNTTGENNGFFYEVNYELYRAKASFFDMKDCVSFSEDVKIMCDCGTWWKESVKDLIETVKESIELAKTLER